MALPTEALELLEPLDPSPELVHVLTEVTGAEVLRGESEAAIGDAERALMLAEQLRLPRPARAMGLRGLVRADLGDPEGLEDLREAIVLASEAGQGRELAVLHNNLGSALWSFEGPGKALEATREGLAVAQSCGLASHINGITVVTLDLLVDTGAPQEALRIVEGLA